MTHLPAPLTAPDVSVPAVRVPAWAWMLAVAALALVYFALQENGAVLGSAATLLHELTHDARHALGVPCH